FDVMATDADGDALTYAWDLDGDSTTDATAKNPTRRYTAAGTYTAKVTVSDGKLEAAKTVTVTVDGAATSTPVVIGSDVPATLSLELGRAEVRLPVHGSYSLPEPLQVRANGAAWTGIPATLLAYTGPTGRSVVTVDFKQSIAETDALRTGRYG